MEDDNDTELDLKPPQKKGYLQKLGGAEGGRQNWKKRFFVLQEDLLYFDNQSQYEKGKEPKGQVTLDCHYTCAVDGHAFEFAVHAYPRTLHCKAESAEEMQDWIDILQKPIHDD